MKRNAILLTGFEPFGPHQTNPSALVAGSLEGATIGGLDVQSALLPVDTARIAEKLSGLLAEAQPVIVIALGLAAGRVSLNVERVAVNVRDFSLADNSGTRAQGEPIVDGGPDAYLATAPARAMAEACRAAGVPACVSNSAGTYLCNQALYLLCHAAASAPRAAPLCGFIHLPCLPEQVAQMGDLDLSNEGWPTMAFETMARGVKAALTTAVAAISSQE